MPSAESDIENYVDADIADQPVLAQLAKERKSLEDKSDVKIEEDSEHELNIEFDLFDSGKTKAEKIQIKNDKRDEEVRLSKERYQEYTDEVDKLWPKVSFIQF